MTDREPDDLFDALRERLADYGQEPPAPLWAAIRAQLPPPVARPMLRARRRWAVLLGLVLLLSVGTWQWARRWPTAGTRGFETAHTGPVAPAAGSDAGSNAGSRFGAEASPTGPAPDKPLAGTARLSQPATASQTTPPANADLPTGAVSGLAATANRPPASEVTPATPMAHTEAPVPTTGTTGPAGLAATVRPPAVGSDASTMLTKPAKTAATRDNAGFAAARAGSIAGPAIAAVNPAKSSSLATRSRVRRGAVAGAAVWDLKKEAVSRSIRVRGAAWAASGVASHLAEPKKVPARGRATRTSLEADPATHSRQLARSAKRPTQRADTSDADNSRAEKATGPVVAMAAKVPAETAAAPISFSIWNRLQPHPVALSVAETTAPMVVRARPEPVRVASPVPARWAVQLLAGPAVTYRHLASPLSEAPAAQIGISSFYTRLGAATSIAEQERPAVSAGVQVQLRRVLNGRWALSTGLGYHEYATSLDLQTVTLPTRAIPPLGVAGAIRDSGQVRSVRSRDTYRFLTVPVRVGYQVGPGGRRFRLGLQGGADVALYLGGATTEGSKCGCETQTWGRTGSPYRPLSLTLSLGLDLRYQVAPRWELLAQPTTTYFLTSLARPTSGFTPRHLLGVSAQLGVAYALP